MPLSGSRTEFLQADALGPAGDIKYGRSGGWFVSVRKALFITILIVTALVLVGVLVYYLAPCRRQTQESATVPENVTKGSLSDTTVPDVSADTEIPMTTSTTEGVPVLPDYRIPTSVKPHYYTIEIQPFIGDESSNFTYKGNVAIQLSCTDEDKCDSITLNAVGLSIDWNDVNVRIVSEDYGNNESRSKNVPKKYGVNTTSVPDGTLQPNVKSHSQDTNIETITINLDPGLETGMNYTLVIPFWGNISDKLTGLYRSGYTATTGEDRWTATTNLYPIYARNVFPCFDEPVMKARFEIHIARRENLTSVSNMPIASYEPVKDQPGWIWDRYIPSPVMSTHSVAFIISDMDALNGTQSEPSMSIWARKDLIHTANYTLSISYKVLQSLTNYLGIKYPLPKLDLVGVPDFPKSVKENWGVIIGRESLLLNDQNISAYNKEFILNLMGHEIARQWFGNLVTMQWWSDTWINEGFATFIGLIGVDRVEPSWNMFDKFLVHELHSVMEVDSLPSTHPTYISVRTPTQIRQTFDDVSCIKGGWLIRMLNNTLTEPVFKKGLAEYLTLWKYGNAKQDDVWDVLTRAVSGQAGLLPEGHTIKEVMDTWTLQGGYPVVTVTRNYTDGSITFTQERFRLDHVSENSSSHDDEHMRWFVPITYSSRDDNRVDDTAPRMWLDQQTAEKRVDDVTKPGYDTWVLVNMKQTGFFRVNYDSTNWDMIMQDLRNESLDMFPVSTRAQLINDALNLARAGFLDYGISLNLTLYLVYEREYVAWKSFMDAFDFLDDIMLNTSAHKDLQTYLISLVRPVEDELGLGQSMNDTQSKKLLQRLILSHLIRAQKAPYVKWAREMFNQWKNSSLADNPITPDLRYDVYCAGIRADDSENWDFVSERLRNTDTELLERHNLLKSLMCTTDTKLITSLLDNAMLENGGFRLQDMLCILDSVRTNPVASRVAFRFVQQKWGDIHNKYADFALKDILKHIIIGLSTQEDLSEVEKFMASQAEKLHATHRTVAQSLELLRLKVLWRKKYFAVVEQWLADYVKNLA